MKKLANLIALFILVSVNIITPITYAEDEDPEVWDKYDCRPDGGDGWRYYVCEPAPEGDYSCWSEEEEGYVCRYDITEEKIYGCNLEDDSYYCPIDYYNMNGSTEEGYYFEPSRGEGEFVCHGELSGLNSPSNQRDASSYGDFVCSRNGGDEEEYYYGCSESGNGFFCPHLYRYQINREKGEYNFFKDEYGYYTCELNNFQDDYPEDTSIVEDSNDTYTCGWLYNCHEDTIGLIPSGDYDVDGYSCPIYYSCYEEGGTIYCQEDTSGQYECKSNLSVGEKGLLDDMGEYSCSYGENTYSCEWDGRYDWDEYDEYGRYGRFECEDPNTIKYSCTFDGKDGYECKEDNEGTYKCVYPDSLIASSIYDNVVCYDDDIYHLDCSPINDGYFCPVKWGTTFDNDGEYECLEYNGPSGNGGGVIQNNGRYEAKYDEELGQCIYTVPGYDKKHIIIMSSNLGVTQFNPIGMYYQWGTGYGYQPSVSDMEPDWNKSAPLNEYELEMFEELYNLETLGNTWSDEADPCPTGFHVPSMKEWNNLFISWCENDEECEEYAGDLMRSDYPENQWALNDPEWHGAYGNIVNRFVEDYGLGLFGSHDGYNINMFGMMGDYWSSERMLGDADISYHDTHGTGMSSWGLTLYPEGGVGPLGFYSHMAASVRCFADVEDDAEVSTPVALDLYIGGCGDSDSIAPTSALEVVEDSMLCNNDGYRGRKFVASGEAVDLDELEDSFLPEGYNWVWYLDDDQTTKLTENTFTHDTVLYAFEEITPITLIITKVRNDADNQDGIRPTSVTVNLYSQSSLLQDTSKNLVTTKVLSEGNGWTATVNDLPQYPNTNYFWEEEAVPGYEFSENTSSQDSSWFITTITNTHTPAVVTKYTVTFNSNGGSAINPVEVVEGQPVNRPNPNPTRNGYTFDGWTLNGEAFDFSASITGNITLKAEWEILHYTITYEDEGTQIPGLEPSSYTIEDSFTLPTLPAKTGYKFDGWSDNGTKITKIQAGNTGNKTLVAIWTEDKPSGGNSGGYSGGGSSHSKGGGGNKSDVESVKNEPSTPAKEESKPDPKPVVPGKGVNNTDKANPNQELFDAYEWAYANGLTKYGNMSDARMNDILNRQEMAKITTIFASKFKNNTPNEDKRDFCSQYPDLWKTTKDMQEYIIQSCELGYMGYRANGIDALDRFRPYTPVSVAEVSIILSRIMWQNKYAINENLWYQGHLHAVYENNLLDNISKPFDYIIRKDAYIMLYRISKTL